MPDPVVTPPVAAPSPVTPPAAPAAPAVETPAPPAAPAGKDPAPSLLTEAPPAAPEEIKLKLPDGMAADEGLISKFLPVAKDLGLKSEGAQRLVDLFLETQKGAETAHMEQITKWAEEAKADPEFGGTAFDANLTIARKAIDRLATPGLKEMLVKSGLGNHKDVIRVFWQVGKLISEDRLPGGGVAPQEAGPSRDDLLKEAFPASPQMFTK